MGIKESNKLSVDASFKTPQSCRDFFKTKSRARLTPVEDVSYCFIKPSPLFYSISFLG